jgi:hypothetical protein
MAGEILTRRLPSTIADGVAAHRPSRLVTNWCTDLQQRQLIAAIRTLDRQKYLWTAVIVSDQLDPAPPPANLFCG